MLRRLWQWIFPPVEVKVKQEPEDHGEDDSIRIIEGVITSLDQHQLKFAIDGKYQADCSVFKDGAEAGLKKGTRVKYSIKYNADEDDWKVLAVDPTEDDDKTLLPKTCSTRNRNDIVEEVRSEAAIAELNSGLERRHKILEASLGLMPKDGTVQQEWDDNKNIISVDGARTNIAEGASLKPSREAVADSKPGSLCKKEYKDTKSASSNFNRPGTGSKAAKGAKAFTQTTEIASVSAVRPPFFVPNKLAQFPIPQLVRNAFELENEDQLRSLYPDLDLDVLTEANYEARFHLALYFEELEQQRIRRALLGLELRVSNISGCYSFIVPSFQELGFAVQRADAFKLENVANPKIRYDGFVEVVRQHEIVVKLSENFKHVPSMLVNVQFQVGHTSFKRQHFAIDHSVKFLGKDWLFPRSVEAQLPRVIFREDDFITEHPRPNSAAVLESLRTIGDEKVVKERSLGVRAKSLKTVRYEVQIPNQALMNQKLRWYNPKLNFEQKNAVRRVLRGQGRPLPYVIFGPPGTGKTITIVEAIMQIYFREKVSRILVTVPSNAGADIIAELLAKSFRFNPGDFIRLNGYSRPDGSVSDVLARFCVDGDDLASAAKHRLIISTVVTAGQFLQLSKYTGHFSHVFIDEAGYCTEPEALIPCILCAVDREGQIILAGDPKQLGPVLKRDTKVTSVLSKSFLERIMETPAYRRAEDKDTYDGYHYNTILLTKLVRNYRSHRRLLKVPSRLFYDDELQACASKETVSKLASLKLLPKKGQPLMFQEVQGVCMRDADSPSFYNLTEAGVIAEYVRLLKVEGLKDEDIGIITPYRKQVDKIREALCTRLKRTCIKVASVQEFQGGEKTVILISTVRSSSDSDGKEISLDFLHSEKMFNVAVTRAKALMIIVGDPNVLYLSKCWREMMRYCVALGVYKDWDSPTILNS